MIVTGLTQAAVTQGLIDTIPPQGVMPVGINGRWFAIPGGANACSPLITAIAAQPIDWSVYNIYNLVLPNAGIVLSPVFLNLQVGQDLWIMTTQGSTASTNNWTNIGAGLSIKFAGGTKSLTASASAIDLFWIICVSPGVLLGNSFLAQA